MANAKTGRVALAARDLETRATELRLSLRCGSASDGRDCSGTTLQSVAN